MKRYYTFGYIKEAIAFYRKRRKEVEQAADKRFYRRMAVGWIKTLRLKMDFQKCQNPRQLSCENCYLVFVCEAPEKMVRQRWCDMMLVNSPEPQKEKGKQLCHYCNKPAVYLDHMRPFCNERTTCEEHKEEWKK